MKIWLKNIINVILADDDPNPPNPEIVGFAAPKPLKPGADEELVLPNINAILNIESVRSVARCKAY